MKAFPPGYSSVLMAVEDVGEINSTVFLSDSLVSVTRFTMDSAGVTGIAEGAFSSFQNLTSLSLNQNLLTNIDPSWFGRPETLRELNLRENLIEGVNGSMLNRLHQLTRLRLSKNRIRTIDPNSFSSSTNLVELDLSENMMTRLPPQVFRSLRSTRIGLNGNPWDCSCGAEDFVDFLKDLQSRSLLDKPMEVTCDTPPSLRGRPAWNVSVCVTSPPPTRPPGTQTNRPKPPVNLTAAPTATTATSVTSSPPSVTEISVHPKPSDLHTATTSPSETRVTSRPPPGTNTVCTLVVVIGTFTF
ncbi:leucine-rich repeat-containing protein 70-like [Centropristis striata]|uniref:leucine-rich repeat-containing protein 70-like n=1 Tax=Centropristis striata TaxID=184440 RepID=UPI0027E0006B|nr:leucine-rich repeat-containing protein 70-like [Centropristis striata]